MRPDLSVKIGSFTFKNPVWVASGTFGNGEELEELTDITKLGAVVMKGATLEPREGNPYSRIVETPSGILNCIGLQNPGLEEALDKKARYLHEKGVAAILNISGHSAEEYGLMAEKAEACPYVAAVEMNVSCPNVKEGGITFGTDPRVLGPAVKLAREGLKTKPLIVKLTPNVTDITVTAKCAEDNGADAVSLINTLTGLVIDTKRRRPVLGNITGGLSGPAVRPVAVRMVWQAAKAVKIPVVGLGGIECLDDALQFFIAGASAVQIGTASFYEPRTAEKIALELPDYLEKNGFSSVGELRGDF
ncbi:dihydroorotate dehydrogenase [bacterium]|nr:dihydroorotate dehydrogenase [bacterium]